MEIDIPHIIAHLNFSLKAKKVTKEMLALCMASPIWPKENPKPQGELFSDFEVIYKIEDYSLSRSVLEQSQELITQLVEKLGNMDLDCEVNCKLDYIDKAPSIHVGFRNRSLYATKIYHVNLLQRLQQHRQVLDKVCERYDTCSECPLHMEDGTCELNLLQGID